MFDAEFCSIYLFFAYFFVTIYCRHYVVRKKIKKKTNEFRVSTKTRKKKQKKCPFRAGNKTGSDSIWCYVSAEFPISLIYSSTLCQSTDRSSQRNRKKETCEITSRTKLDISSIHEIAIQLSAFNLCKRWTHPNKEKKNRTKTLRI